MRHSFATEIRAQGRRLSGLAAVFDRPTSLGGGRTEVVRRGAFAGSLRKGTDILALADHDPARVLGRTAAGTLRLHETREGLAFEIDLPHTTAANDILALVETRNAGGMSFGFVAEDAPVVAGIRELRQVRLDEISVVSAWPAYQGTVVEARSRLAAARLFMETVR